MCSVLWIGTLSIVHWCGTSATMCSDITYTIKITAMTHNLLFKLFHAQK